MNQDRTFAWVSYLTFIGWIISIIMYNDSQKGNTLVRFHLRQTLGIYLMGVASSILMIIPIIGWIASFVLSISAFVFWIMGLINAAQGEEKPVPVLGTYFQEWFTFIK